MKKKKAFTLLEIMMVIFLIGLIGSIVGYNMKGSLDEGKAFKTEQAILKAQDLLELELARGAPSSAIEENPAQVLASTGVISKPKQFLKDGWGETMTVKVHGDRVTISSKKLSSYKGNKTKKRGYELDFDEEEE